MRDKLKNNAALHFKKHKAETLRNKIRLALFAKHGFLYTRDIIIESYAKGLIKVSVKDCNRFYIYDMESDVILK